MLPAPNSGFCRRQCQTDCLAVTQLSDKITSGSSRNAARNPDANVIRANQFPAAGSNIAGWHRDIQRIFQRQNMRIGMLIEIANHRASVVDLPLPVAPVTRIRPFCS